MKPNPEEIDSMNEEFDRDQKGEFHIMTAAETKEWRHSVPQAPLQLHLNDSWNMNCYGQPRGARSLINGELVWPEEDMDYTNDKGLHYDEQFRDRDGH